MIYESLYTWYEQNKRALPWRETNDPYAIWISEIILQQTRVSQGLGYYYRFLEAFPTVQALAAASEEQVLRLWQGLGYYSRARNLHRSAKIISEAGGLFPSTFEQLKQLPGVGEYTAGAIAAFAYNLPYPALDGNVYRVLARLYDCALPFDTAEGKKFFRSLAYQLLDSARPRLFDSAIMEFGALYCVEQHPDCEACPLRWNCLAQQHHTVDLLPVRKPRLQLKDRYFNYTIYIQPAASLGASRTLIHQRQAKDIWQHLYEFVLEEGTELLPSEQYFDLTHILSHQRIHARFHIKKVASLPLLDQYIAVSFEQLDQYALSRLTLKALERLEA